MERRNDHRPVCALHGQEPVLQVHRVVIFVHPHDTGVANGKCLAEEEAVVLEVPVDCVLRHPRTVESPEVASVEDEGVIQVERRRLHCSVGPLFQFALPLRAARVGLFREVVLSTGLTRSTRWVPSATAEPKAFA